MWRIYLAVMAGGAAGVGARMFLSNWIANHFGQSFPWGTLIVNVTGCLIIGVFTGLTGPDGMVMTSPLTRQVVAIGVLGGFTTYSSFSLQTINLLTEGEVLYALANITLTLLLCLIGTWSGLILASLMQSK
ncbi:MAG: fluoride efflux transporter CrcB [Verrucomicrobia bacterium]|nr:fluoride efflux transporter CrcB [Verrucomicrobiota bacterium]